MARRPILAAVVLGGAATMVVAGLVLALMLAFGRGHGLSFGQSVAVLEVEGVLIDDEELLEQLRRFREDPSVRALVVKINSPGGSVAPSQSLYQELARFRDEEERPVIAAIGSVGASGGYYVALGADSILALPGSITGSIGVIMEFPQVQELMDKVGVRMEVVKSSPHKDIGSPFRGLEGGDREILEALVQDVYDQFVGVVAEERNLPLEQVHLLADGRILSGRQALDHGLVDRMGNISEAVRVAGRMAGLGEDPRVVRPPEDRFGVLDLLMGKGVVRGMERALQALGGSWGPRLRFVPLY